MENISLSPTNHSRQEWSLVWLWQALNCFQAWFRIKWKKTSLPGSLQPHRESTCGLSQGFAISSYSPTTLKPKNKPNKKALLLRWCKVLLLISLWHKSFPRSSFTRVNLHMACKCPPTPSLNSLIYQGLIHMCSYFLKADILKSSLFSPQETSLMKYQLKISSKDLNYHIRDSPPRMNNRKGTF